MLYRLPGPTAEGRTVLALTPLELIERLAALIPPPRVHRHRYHLEKMLGRHPELSPAVTNLPATLEACCALVGPGRWVQ